MKIIQKTTLCLFAMLGLSTWNAAFAAAELEVNFTNGASYDGVITGKANFNGTGIITLVGSVTDDVKVTAGTVKVASAASFGADINMNGGTLEPTAAMSLPSMAINVDSILKADADTTLLGMSGANKLTVTGVGAVTPADLHAASTIVDVNGIVHVGATGSLLPAGAVTVKSAGLVKLMGIVQNCVPGAMEVKTGGILEVAAALTIPATGSGDLFGTLKFESGAELRLGNGSTWDRPVVVGTYS